MDCGFNGCCAGVWYFDSFGCDNGISAGLVVAIWFVVGTRDYGVCWGNKGVVCVWLICVGLWCGVVLGLWGGLCYACRLWLVWSVCV